MAIKLTEAQDSPVKKTVLFVAEAVTLAHFGRMMTLARALDATKYHIVVAADPRYLGLEQPFPFQFEAIWTIPGEKFAQALAQGKAVYDAPTLRRYVEDDLKLLNKIKPDLVIGDFRLSLAVSAPLAQVAYATVVNAYWSPYANISYPVPDIPLTKVLGLRLGQKVFNLVRPVAFALHARPLNTVRRHYGLGPVGANVRSAYTWADHVFYADIPELIPLSGQPASHHYLGPILWSAKTPLPGWWVDLPRDKPIVFASPGSSGQTDLLPSVLEAMGQLPVTVIAATAGRIELPAQADNVFVTDYLPMEEAVQVSSLMICNGGSLTTYQALTTGVPILGLTTNMDQLLNMQAIEQQGVGVSLRQGTTNSAQICRVSQALLNGSSYAVAAKRMVGILSGYDSDQRFRDVLGDILLRV